MGEDSAHSRSTHSPTHATHTHNKQQEAEYVCNYIVNGGDKAEFLAKFKNAVSEGFDPDKHLTKVCQARAGPRVDGGRRLTTPPSLPPMRHRTPTPNAGGPGQPDDHVQARNARHREAL